MIGGFIGKGGAFLFFTCVMLCNALLFMIGENYLLTALFCCLTVFSFWKMVGGRWWIF